MKRKPLIALLAVTALLFAAYALGGHYLHVKSLSRLTGLAIPFSARLSIIEESGMMGGTRETWLRVSGFPALLDQCRSDAGYVHGVIDYRKYRVLDSRFTDRGLGRAPGCIKEIRTAASTTLIAIDGGHIVISEQWQ